MNNDVNINSSTDFNSESDSMTIPTIGLPDWAEAFVYDMETCYQCPRNFVLSALFVATSAVMGNKVSIVDGKYRNPLSLWFVNVAPSGSNKTAPVRNVLEPLFRINSLMLAEYREQKALAIASEKSPKPLAMPVCHQLIVNDTTEEARMKVLANNPHGILCYYPEIKGFFDDMGRYSSSDGSSKLLRIFDYDDFIVNRKTDDEIITITNPFMSIIGDIQPELVKQVFGNERFLWNGLNQRFLFNYEPSPAYVLYSEQEPSETLKKQWWDIVAQMHRFQNPTDRPAVLSAEAKAAYVGYFNGIQLRKYTMTSDYERSILSKCQIQVIRLAGVVHFMKCAPILNTCADPVTLNDIFTIDLDDMQYAIACMECYEKSARVIYRNIVGENPAANSLSGPDLIRLLAKTYDIKSRAQLADSLGLSRAAISKYLS